MNLKDWTIGKRIGFGFGVILVMLIIIGYLSFSGVGRIVANAADVIDGNRLDGLLAQKEVDHLNWANKVNALLTDDQITTLSVQTDPTKCAFGQWLYGEDRRAAESLIPALMPLLKDIEVPHQHLHASASEIDKLFVQADIELGGFLREKKIDHLKWMHLIKDAFLDPNVTELKVQTDPEKCSLGQWIYSSSTKVIKNHNSEFKSHWDKLEQYHRNLHLTATTINNALQREAREEAIRLYRDHTQGAAEDALAAIDRILAWHDSQIEGMETAKAIYATETVPSLRKIQNLLKKIRGTARKFIMTDEAMLHTAVATRRNVSIVGLIAIAMGGILAFFITRGIVSALRNISGQVDEGADQVASAAGQVSSASQSLAGGASTQAASLEETSSSLEEMASMTGQNADNASQANRLMDDTNRIVANASREMKDLDQSMRDISEASQETQKIVKTIDEIAFQTNLLALNAAVEAARAGEAGAGFAVVADEVRNLAMRAAEAAKTTSHLINSTSQRVADGAAYVTRAGQAFDEITQSTGKAGELVAEIAAASSEQAQGVEQINRAVTEMDQVVQQNAATAEESASASEEMSAQAQQMQHMVSELICLVDAGKRKSIPTTSRVDTVLRATPNPKASGAGLPPAEPAPTPVIPG